MDHHAKVTVTRAEAWKTLQITEEDAEDEKKVKDAYFRLAKQWHPDKNLDNIEEANTQFKLIAAAYVRLSEQKDQPDPGEDDDDDDFDAYDFNDAMAAQLFRFMNEMGRGSGFPGGGFQGSFSSGSFPFSMHVGGQPGGRSGEGNYYKPSVVVDDDHYDSDDSDDYDDMPDLQEEPGGGRGGWGGGGGAPASGQESRKQRQERLKAMKLEQEFQKKERQRNAAKAKREAAAANLEAQSAPRQSKAEKKAAAARRKKAEEERVRAANAAARAEVAAFQPGRPTMLKRGEDSITLCLSKKASGDEASKMQWQLQFAATTGNRATFIVTSPTPEATANDLLPGTKYDFQSRRGMTVAGEMVMSQWSASSTYTTSGDPPRAAAPKEVPVVSKSKKKERQEKASKQQKPAVVKQEDPEEIAARLKAEKEREAAMKAAMAKAAEEYAQEAAKLASVQETATKPGARPVPKSRATRAKSRKPREPENDFWAPVIPEPKKVSVGDLPPVDAPTVKKINFGSASQFGPRGREWAGGDDAMSEYEQQQLQEALELSMALEASRLAEQEDALRQYKPSAGQSNVDIDAFGGVAPRGKGGAASTSSLAGADGWGGSDWDDGSHQATGIGQPGGGSTWQEEEAPPVEPEFPPGMARPTWDQGQHKPKPSPPRPPAATPAPPRPGFWEEESRQVPEPTRDESGRRSPARVPQPAQYSPPQASYAPQAPEPRQQAQQGEWYAPEEPRQPHYEPRPQASHTVQQGDWSQLEMEPPAPAASYAPPPRTDTRQQQSWGDQQYAVTEKVWTDNVPTPPQRSEPYPSRAPPTQAPYNPRPYMPPAAVPQRAPPPAAAAATAPRRAPLPAQLQNPSDGFAGQQWGERPQPPPQQRCQPDRQYSQGPPPGVQHHPQEQWHHQPQAPPPAHVQQQQQYTPVDHRRPSERHQRQDHQPGDWGALEDSQPQGHAPHRGGGSTGGQQWGQEAPRPRQAQRYSPGKQQAPPQQWDPPQAASRPPPSKPVAQGDWSQVEVEESGPGTWNGDASGWGGPPKRPQPSYSQPGPPRHAPQSTERPQANGGWDAAPAETSTGDDDGGWRPTLNVQTAVPDGWEWVPKMSSLQPSYPGACSRD